MFNEPTTIEQQIEFVQEMRDSFDSEQRERIALIRTPEQTAQLLKDIHENLIGVRNWQHGQDVPLCDHCNKPKKVCNCAGVLDSPKLFLCPECGHEVDANGFDSTVPVMCTRSLHDVPVQMEGIYN